MADEFEPKFDALDENVQTEILVLLPRLQQQFGPQLGRPRVDTSKRLTAREHEGPAVQGGWGVAAYPCL